MLTCNSLNNINNNPAFSQNKLKPNGKIAIMDVFRPEYPAVDVNNDCAPDIPHGEAVKIYLESILKKYFDPMPKIEELIMNQLYILIR